jgi:hypothetical protein
MDNSELFDKALIETSLASAWYTADSAKPYLVKAAANIQNNGYVLLITDLEHTYFCAADVETILKEKKVRIIAVMMDLLQKYNPTIETEGTKELI